MSTLDHVVLVAREGCAACDGTGGQISDDWAAFEAWATRQRLDDQARDDAVEHYFLTVCDYFSVPPMRETCAPCAGSGRTEREVPWIELVTAVLEHVRRPLLTGEEIDEVVGHVKRSMTAAALNSQGLADADEVGSWLRACQEAAETLRSLAELRPQPQEI